MENIVLIIHLILALLLIGAVLLQRSEGGALGMGGGGGGGGGGVMSGRSAATALQKATWGLAVAFIITSLILTIFATQSVQDGSVVDTLPPLETNGEAPALPAIPALPQIDGTLTAPITPDSAGGDEPAAAPAGDDTPALPPAQ
ncbi:MAG: preprotein translocase subunit SecG [Pseudomonadota bacterium]